jgi:hypothetical protein
MLLYWDADSSTLLGDLSQVSDFFTSRANVLDKGNKALLEREVAFGPSLQNAI